MKRENLKRANEIENSLQWFDDNIEALISHPNTTISFQNSKGRSMVLWEKECPQLRETLVTITVEYFEKRKHELEEELETL